MSAISFFKQIFRRAPLKIAILVVLIILAGGLEGISFTLFIPLIRIITASSGAMAGAADGNLLNKIFSVLGLGSSLPLLLLFIVAVGGAKDIFQYLQRMIAVRISVDFELDLKKNISSSVFASGWQFYMNEKVGTLINAVGAASNKASMAFQMETQLCAEVLNVMLYCVVGLLISWQAFLISMFAGFLYVHFSKNLIRVSRYIGVEGVNVDSSSQSAVLEDFTGIKFIKGNALEEQRKQNFFSLIDQYGKVAYRREKYGAILETLPEFIMVIIMCGIFYVSHTFFRVPGENLLVLLAILYRFNRRIMTLQTLRQRLVNYLPSYELCVDIIDRARSLKEKTGTKIFEKLRNNITFDDVGFFYDSQPVLDSVNLEIRKNQFVAFVGKSGSGKTTLIDLIVGLLKARKGTIRIDGQPIDEYNIFTWREHMAYVSQEPFLVNGTIAENIRMSSPQASMEEVKIVANMAHADEFITTFKDGYDTLVGNRGTKLSGGQCQRIALARALIGKPEVLVLDEATSALDNRSESMIQKALDELKGSLTIIVIAHRLTTIRKADVIYVLDKGKISDVGTMQSLKESSSVFKDIYLVD